ncbi:FAD-dependent oxidoreductase [Actinocrinis puniceicyclus]|uniref:FAD-dependent oxidoreductase n=1 Tax=Actinocrinis puniceicyclus TaxID=977794 RepID=A0A8J7WR78_9ACTN|nr:FAD-dependent oxidoreductase [Actinocrinis puniceicyclus]MBS2965165.1 FAD-dependent oxidoreductase [Actinocrinis puniceicyclus]
MPESAGMVIVGAGLAGAKAAQALRTQGYGGRIVLVGDEPSRPYQRPPLSKEYLQGTAGRDALFVHPEGWYRNHDVDLRLGSAATAIHPRRHEIVLRGGERIGYAKLLLATGATPRPLRVPGGPGAPVLYLRRVEDSERIRAALLPDARLVVVGAGWIGLEAAAAVRAAGAHVTVVESAELPLLRALGPEMAPVFAHLHRAHGVDLRFAAEVAAIEGTGRGPATVHLTDGTALDADAVIAGIGAAPNAGLAADAGLAVEDGIVVDASLRTSDPDIYAAGDVARALHPLYGKHIRVEHWAGARHQPAVAARAMLGDGAAVYDRVPFFYSDQYDVAMEFSGHIEPGGYDEVVVRGDTGRAGDGFLAFWLAGDRVLAGMSVNVRGMVKPIERLVRCGKPVNPAILADPGLPLPRPE